MRFTGLVGGIAGGAIGSAIHRGLRSNSTRSAERKGIDEETRPKCKDPIDPVSGEMVEIRTDLSIPGVLPLELKRRYRTRSNARGLLGKRCSDTWSQRLTLTNQRFVYFDDGAGLEIGFDAPLMALDGINLTAPRYRLVGSRLEPRLLDREARELRIFSPLVENRPSRLERIEDLDGNTINDCGAVGRATRWHDRSRRHLAHRAWYFHSFRPRDRSWNLSHPH